MKFTNRDLLFAAVIAAVLGTLYLSTGGAKTKHVPYDDRHIKFYNVMLNGGDRATTEKGCAACHGLPTAPLPRSHPPKEQCLLCHKLAQDNK